MPNRKYDTFREDFDSDADRKQAMDEQAIAAYHRRQQSGTSLEPPANLTELAEQIRLRCMLESYGNRGSAIRAMIEEYFDRVIARFESKGHTLRICDAAKLIKKDFEDGAA